MTIKTPQDIIKLALKDCGAVGEGQDPSAEDMNDGHDTLNMMLAQWNRKRWLIWHTLDVSVVSTGAETYTIGPGGNINMTVRPDRLEAAFLRLLTNPAGPLDQVDYDVEVLQAREDYNRIPLKNLPSFPTRVFYDPVYPLGVLYPYPVPQASIYELHFTVKDILVQFPALNTAINLPNEYYMAMFYNLAVRLGIRYPISRDFTQVQQWQYLVGLAKDSLNVLRGANAAIARLTMPQDLVRSGQYNIYSDTQR